MINKILAILSIALILYTSKSPNLFGVIMCVVLTAICVTMFFKKINEDEK